MVWNPDKSHSLIGYCQFFTTQTAYVSIKNWSHFAPKLSSRQARTENTMVEVSKLNTSFMFSQGTVF